MIKTKKELDFYIKADRMMRTGSFTKTWKQRLCEFFGCGDDILVFLEYMRKCSYYGGGRNLLIYWYIRNKYNRLSTKLGFSINCDVFGYGVVIPHYGTIVVGSTNKIGNYSVLHTSTCITANGKTIGDALYCSTGVKLTGKVTLGDNVMIAANSVVTKSHEEGNVLLAGMPAVVKRCEKAWWTSSEKYAKRVQKIEELKVKYGLQ